MNIKGFVQDKNVDSQDELIEIYNREDGNDDYWIEIVEPQNNKVNFQQRFIIPYIKCSRVGIWIWDETMPESLEEFVNKIAEHYYGAGC